MFAGILFLKNFVHGECYFTLGGGAGYFSIDHDTAKMILAGVDEKLKHTFQICPNEHSPELQDCNCVFKCTT